jgi:hypothetical protein
MKNINEFEKEHPELVDRLGDTILLWLSWFLKQLIRESIKNWKNLYFYVFNTILKMNIR